MSKIKLSAVALLMLFMNGYGPSAPRLDFVWKDNLTDEDMIRDAPIIIIGKVNSATLVGPVRDGYRLMEVSTTVESVIRGDLTSPIVSFYFYFPYYGFSGDLNLPVPEGRYVLFLMWDSGIIRAVRDALRTNIQVYSGKHASLPLSPDRPLTERIATLLLTPGDEINPSSFGVGLLHGYYFSAVHLGRWQTANTLKALLSSPYRAIRIGACEELTLDFRGQDECWDTLEVGDGTDLRYHHGVITPMVGRKSHRYHQRESEDPEKWWHTAQRNYSKAELLDELKLLTTDNDERTRRRFCGLLREKYPLETDYGCDVRQR